MKIGILTSANSPFWHGYAREFTRQGHQVELYGIDGSAPRVDGIPVFSIGQAGFDPMKCPSRWPYIKCILPLRRLLRRNRPDILMAMYLTSGGLIGCLGGHPALVVSALGSDVNTRADSTIWRFVIHWVCRRAGLVHAVSDDLAQKLIGRFGVPGSKVMVAPIGVDTEALPLIDPTSRPHCGRIVNTRAHKPLYDQATFVKAMRRLKDRKVKFHAIFASDRSVERTQELVRQHGVEDEVTFLGGYRDDQLLSILTDADVYVSSSTTDGTSQSLLEAMSTGLFPVVSDIVANRPWVRQGENGLLFPVGDDKALALQLEESIGNPQMRANAAPLSRKIVVAKGDLTSLAGELLAAFQRMKEMRTTGVNRPC